MLLDFDRCGTQQWPATNAGSQAAGLQLYEPDRLAAGLQLTHSLHDAWLPDPPPALVRPLLSVRLYGCRFDLIKELLKNRLRIVWCTRLARAEVGLAGTGACLVQSAAALLAGLVAALVPLLCCASPLPSSACCSPLPAHLPPAHWPPVRPAGW